MWWLLACGPRAEDFDWRNGRELPDPTDPPPRHTAAAHTGSPHTGVACEPPVWRHEVLIPVDSAIPGDTVALGSYADTPAWPSATPGVTDGGGALWFSDSPETVDAPGLLYGDAAEGPGRLALYHASGAGALRYAVLARGQGAAEVEIGAAGLAGPSTDVLYTGRMAAARWLASAAAGDHRTVAVPDGAWVELEPALDVEVRPGRLIHGLWDVAVTGRVDLRFVAVTPGDDPAAVVDGLAPAARDGHDRGTFAPADRALDLGCLDTAGGSFRLRLGDGVDDPAAAGTDALTGAPEVLHGNYGVRYRLTARLSSSDERLLAVLIAPRGGPLAGGVQVSDGLFRGGVSDVPRDADVVRPGDAVLVQVWDATHPDVEVVWTPPGGSSLPVDVLFVSFLP